VRGRERQRLKRGKDERGMHKAPADLFPEVEFDSLRFHKTPRVLGERVFIYFFVNREHLARSSNTKTYFYKFRERARIRPSRGQQLVQSFQ
jgi:hypothetical protein